MPGQPKIFSFDSILLSLLVVANISLMEEYSFQKSFYIGLVLLYIVLDFLSSNSWGKRQFLGIPLEEHSRMQKRVVLYLVIFLLVLWPSLSQMQSRHEKGLQYFAHDGLIQTEAAVNFLLQGKNPYSMDYLNTPLANWSNWNSEKYGINPALYHHPYLPFLSLFALPFQAISNAVIGWFDLRFVFTALFIAVIFILERLASDESRRIQMLMLFALNPWFTDFFDEGRNDIFILAWIALSIYALKKKHVLLSSIFAAFACLSKQTAWPFIPFYFAYLMNGQFTAVSLKQAVRKSYPFFILSAIVIVPFLVWDCNSFIDDIFSFHSGSTAFSYPAVGYGFSGFLTESGFIKYGDYFPFWIFQLAFGLPLMLLMLKMQSENNSLKNMVLNSTLLAFVLLFFSRSFHDSYLGYLTCLMALGYYMDE